MKRPWLLGIEPPCTLDQLRRLSAQAIGRGFCGVEWTLTAELPQRPPATPVDAAPRIGALAVRCETCDLDGAVIAVCAQLRAAAAMGAKVLNLHLPPVRQNGGGGGFGRYQEGLNFAYELLHRARHEAEATGVAVALEAADGGCLLSPVELREIIDAADSWAAGACVDSARIAVLGSPVDWIETLRDRVQAVRLSQGPGELHRGAAGGWITCAEELVHSLRDVPPNRPLIVSGQEAERWACQHIPHPPAIGQAQGTDSVCRQRD